MQGLKGFGEGLMEAASASSAMSTQEAQVGVDDACGTGGSSVQAATTSLVAQAFGSPAAAENNMKAVLGQALGEAKQSLLGEAQSKAKEVLAGQDVPAKQVGPARRGAMRGARTAPPRASAARRHWTAGPLMRAAPLHATARRAPASRQAHARTWVRARARCTPQHA